MFRLRIATTVCCLGMLAVATTASARIAATGQTQKSPPEVKPDNTYGEGGTRTTTFEINESGSRITHVELKDKNGVVREFHRVTSGSEADTTMHEWFDEKGKKTQENGTSQSHKDGERIWTQSTWKDDKQLTGDSWAKDADGHWKHDKFNPATGKYEPASADDLPKIPGLPRADDLGVPRNLTLGGSFIFENSFKGFITYGIDASYTHPIARTGDSQPEFGLMADLQWTHGSDDADVSYGKLQAMGGLAWCEREWRRGMYFGAHVLAGISQVRSEYNGMASDSATSFALAAGFDAGKRVTDRYDVNVRVDYNPTMGNGDVRNNIRLAAGLRFRF